MSTRMVNRDLVKLAVSYLQALFHVFESRQASLSTGQEDRILGIATFAERKLLQVLPQ
jgi:hypothetical protein